MAHGPAFWLPTIVQPIGTVLIGIAGFVIARRQSVTANEKFRFDLFEKRFEIYQSVSSDLIALMQEGEDNVDFLQIERFEIRLIEIRLFFGKEIASQIRHAATAARRLFAINNANPEYTINNDNLDKKEKLFSKITYAGAYTLSHMRIFIDFSRNGRPRKSEPRATTIWLFKGLKSDIEWIKQFLRKN